MCNTMVNRFFNLFIQQIDYKYISVPNILRIYSPLVLQSTLLGEQIHCVNLLESCE